MSTEKTAYQSLTTKQKRFVDAYVGDEAFGNATKAARLAGYSSPMQQGSETRHRPTVAAAIEERLSLLSLSKNEILAGVSRLARGQMADFITVGGSDLGEEAQQLIAHFLTTADLILAEVRDEGGLPPGTPELIEQKREELAQIAEQVRKAVHSRPWVFDLEKAEREGLLHLIAEIGTTESGATKLKLHDPLRALELLGKFHKLWTDKVEHTGPAGGPLIIKEVVIEMPADEEDPDAGDEPFPD